MVDDVKGAGSGKIPTDSPSRSNRKLTPWWMSRLTQAAAFKIALALIAFTVQQSNSFVAPLRILGELGRRSSGTRARMSGDFVSTTTTPADDFDGMTTASAYCAATGSGVTAINGSAAQASSGMSQLMIRNKAEGYDLHGILAVKRADTTSVWVLCHGLCSSCNGTVSRFVSDMLDINTFRFDFAGCGKSGGDWKYAGYDREVSDLRAVVLRLRELGWSVDCVLGHSKGAAAVLRYGEKFDDVDLIVNMAGRFDTSQTPRSRFTEEQWKQLEETGSFVWTVKGEDLTIYRRDFEERAALDMRRTAKAIKKSRVLTIHGKDDETIPVADAYEFDRVLPNNELVIVEGATHRFATAPEQIKVIEALAPYVRVDPSTEKK